MSGGWSIGCETCGDDHRIALGLDIGLEGARALCDAAPILYDVAEDWRRAVAALKLGCQWSHPLPFELKFKYGTRSIDLEFFRHHRDHVLVAISSEGDIISPGDPPP